MTVVTALNGAVGGGGIGVALCADLVIAAESAKLGGGYSAIGLAPDAGASWELTRRAGAMRAKELLITNRAISAAQCLEWGIVNAVVPDAELTQTVDRLAADLAGAAHGSLMAIKTLIDGQAGRSLAEQFALEQQLMVRAAGTSDAREGVEAFLQKRKPNFC